MPLARTCTAGCVRKRHLQRDTSKNADPGPRPPQTHGPRLRMVTAAFDTPGSTPTPKVLLFCTHSTSPNQRPLPPRTSSPDQDQPGARIRASGLTPARGQRCEDREGTHAQKRTSRARAGLAGARSLRLQNTSPRMPQRRRCTCAARGRARVGRRGALQRIPALQSPVQAPNPSSKENP